MKRTRKLVVANGTYTDAAGAEKTSWLHVGNLLTDKASERVSIKLDALPVNFDGWIQAFKIEDDQAAGGGGGSRGQSQGQTRQAPPADDDDIPF